MSARRLAYVLGSVVLVTSGTYVVVYLVRWEWNRAMFSGFLFLATQLALATAVLLERLGRLDRRLDELGSPASPDVLARIREAAPPARPRFEWLGPSGDRLGVFVPALLGAGALLSALAWLVERLARATAQPVLERGLARRLSAVRFPDGGFVDRSP